MEKKKTGWQPQKNMFKFVKFDFFYGCEKHHVMMTRYPLRTSISLRKETHEPREFPVPCESKVPPPMPPQEIKGHTVTYGCFQK